MPSVGGLKSGVCGLAFCRHPLYCSAIRWCSAAVVCRSRCPFIRGTPRHLWDLSHCRSLSAVRRSAVGLRADLWSLTVPPIRQEEEGNYATAGRQDAYPTVQRPINQDKDWNRNCTRATAAHTSGTNGPSFLADAVPSDSRPTAHISLDSQARMLTITRMASGSGSPVRRYETEAARRA